MFSIENMSTRNNSIHKDICGVTSKIPSIIAIKKDLKVYCTPQSSSSFTQSLKRSSFPSKCDITLSRRNSCSDIHKSKILNRPKQRSRPISRKFQKRSFKRWSTLPAASRFRLKRHQHSLFHDFKFPTGQTSDKGDTHTLESSSTKNWRQTRFTNALCDRAKLVSWEIASGIDAVKECGTSFGNNCCDAGVKVAENTSNLCRQTSKMADNRIQELKRSISSWSLSTFKKPKISGPKKLKFNLFQTKPHDRPSTRKHENTESNGRRECLSSVSDQPEMEEILHISEETISKHTESPYQQTHTNNAIPQGQRRNIDNVKSLGEIDYIDNSQESSECKSSTVPAVQYQGDDYSWNNIQCVSPNMQYNAKILHSSVSSSPSVNAENYPEPTEDSLQSSKLSKKSRSEQQIHRLGVNPKTKDEIVLNTSALKPKSNESRKKSFLNMFRRDRNKKKVDDSSSVSSDVSRTESIKKIFGIRRKLSIKPIGKQDEAELKRSERHIASTPLALTDASRSWNTKELRNEHSDADTGSSTENSADYKLLRRPLSTIDAKSCSKPNPVEFLAKTFKNMKETVGGSNNKTVTEPFYSKPERKSATNAYQDNVDSQFSRSEGLQTESWIEPRKISDVKEAAINATVNNAMQVTTAKLNEEGLSPMEIYTRLNLIPKSVDKSLSRNCYSNNALNENGSILSDQNLQHINPILETEEPLSYVTNEVSKNENESSEPLYYQNVLFDSKKNSKLHENSSRCDTRIPLVVEPSNNRQNSFETEGNIRPYPAPRHQNYRLSYDETTFSKERSNSDGYKTSIEIEKTVEVIATRQPKERTFDETKRNEPIYWEIGNTSSVPRPNPRKKKQQSMQDLPIKSISTLHLPRWIQQRPPMPNPRMKKQHSTQSLQSSKASPPGSGSPQGNVFGNSFMNMNFNESDTCLKEKWYDENFYSGKAASVAYGMSSGLQSPPAAPMRGKKCSLISLPGSFFGTYTTRSNSFTQKIRPESENEPMQPQRQKKKMIPSSPLKGQVQTSPTVTNSAKHQLYLLAEFLLSVNPSQHEADELLSEVLYSVHSLIGHNSGNGRWVVTSNENTGRKEIAIEQKIIESHLKETFQVTEDRFQELWKKAQLREPAAISLFVKVVQAKGLRPKTVRGASNPYVVISLVNKKESHRSKLEHETLNPVWNQEFHMQIKNLQKEYLNVEVWHEYHLVDAEQVTAVRNIRGLTRLVKETNATFTHKQDAHLLGAVRIPLSDLRQGYFNQWLDLQKDSSKGIQKDRGSILITINVGQQSGSSANANRQSLDALLGRLVYHHIQTTTNNNNGEESSMQVPWRGQLPPEAKAIIAQHSIVMGLNEAQQNLSWWIVGSRLTSSDAEWLHVRLKNVQEAMSKNEYGQTELETVGESLYLWTRQAIQKLRTIETSFPTASGIVARHQLAYILKIIMSIQENADCRLLLEKRNVPDIRIQTKDAVIEHAKIWWKNLLDEELKGARDIEEQFTRVVKISNETFYFLSNVAVFYSPVLLTEASIPFFRESYILLTQQLNHCARPLLMNAFSKDGEGRSTGVPDKQFTLGAGSVLWQLYQILGRIYQLGQELPMDVREKSGLNDYHRWFTRAVIKYLEESLYKSQDMIKKAIELDNFEPIDAFCNFSSSATDVAGVFLETRLWWKNLCWPDAESSGVLLAKILEDTCSCGMIYADLLKNKVDAIYNNEITPQKQIISKPVCIGLNNIDRVRLELVSLPRQFCVDEISDKIQTTSPVGNDASYAFNTNITMLISNSTENMENKIEEFIETVIEKMLPTLHDAVHKACEDRSEESLLLEVLDPSLQLLQEKLNENNFICFIKKLWEALIRVFRSIINQNSTRRKASYFDTVCDILEKTSKFFSPSIGVGLQREEAQNAEYWELRKLLEFLCLTSESLISKYYQERYDEQNTPSVASRGELAVRAFFTKMGKLFVEVIMAKNIGSTGDSGSTSSKNNNSFSTHNVDSYVKLQIVPSEWFPHIIEKKTKTMRNSDPAVYEETFEFDISENDNGVLEGWILFTLKDYNIGRSNTFIGEAFLPLKELVCVDSSKSHTVRNKFLKVTMPGIEAAYGSLTTLKLRPADKVATNFTKKIARRFTESRAKRIQTYSSDEEKSKSSTISNIRKKLNFTKNIADESI